VVTVDFNTKLARTVNQHDFIMVVVEKMTKEAHFIHVKKPHKVENIADIYMKEASMLHGISKLIFLDKDSKFTSKLWQGLFKVFGTNMNLSTTYHCYTLFSLSL
jgi:hypothetical protein